jgi:hypothetical protein
MRNPQPDLDGYDVARLPRLHISSVVGELQTLAEVQVARGGVVTLLGSGELGELFDVGCIILLNGVHKGGAAGSGYGGADCAGGRDGDYAVGESGGEEGKESGGSGEVHFEGKGREKLGTNSMDVELLDKEGMKKYGRRLLYLTS